MSQDLQIALVSPEIWQPLLQDSLAALEPREARFARAINEIMQNRHLGITPQLAADLAIALLKPAAQAQAGAWSAVFERLLAELSTGRGPRSGGPRGARFGLVLNANPMYCVTRVAIPLLERVCRESKTNYLFCEEKVVSEVTREIYLGYSYHLAQRIKALAENQDRQDELFWQEIALTLSSFSRRTLGQASALPETDPAALALLLRLRAGKPTVRRRLQKQQRFTSTSKHRQMRNRKEGGINGIQITRRAEDLDGMLLSEFINPELILSDRLANTGYFALQRQPKREMLRDVLLGAILPLGPKHGLIADFIKACWFEAVLHLSLLLRRHGMSSSEFRWTEGSPFGNTRQSAFLLKEMPTFQNIHDGPPSEALRREFITALGWMPAFLDDRNLPVRLPDGVSGTEHRELERIKRWVHASWTSQHELLKWRDQDKNRGGTNRDRGGHINIGEFSHAHVMVFLPASLRVEGQGADLGSLFAGLGLSRRPGSHVSVTWIPDTVNPGPGWSYETRNGRGGPLFRGKEPDLGARDMAGHIVETWLNQWIKEIWRA